VKDGRDLAFNLSTSADPVWLAAANKVAEQWSAIGVTVTVQNVGSTGLVRDVLEPRSFDVVLFAGVGEADPDPYPAWHSSQTGPTSGNLSQLDDDRIDAILEEGRAVANQPRRQELYVEFQALFAEQVPAIPLYVTTALYVQPASLRGVRAGLLDTPGARFWQVHEWYLKTR
jgi:peptide/nickel transport system substrate-binding protein